MNRFSDRRLRSQILTISILPVAGMVAAILLVFVLSLGRVVDTALPRQEIIMELQSLSFDLLSETREYALEPNVGTLAEIRERERELLDRVQAFIAAAPQSAGDDVRNAVEAMMAATEKVVLLAPADEGSDEAAIPEGVGADYTADPSAILELTERDLRSVLRRERAISSEKADGAFRIFFGAVVGTGFFGLLASVILALVLSNQISKRVGRLRDASQRLAAGDLGARLTDSGSDEIGELASSFNRMAEEIEQLVARIHSAHAYSEGLLETVPTAIAAIDAEGRVVSSNRELTQRFGNFDGRRLDDLDLTFDSGGDLAALLEATLGSLSGSVSPEPPPPKEGHLGDRYYRVTAVTLPALPRPAERGRPAEAGGNAVPGTATRVPNADALVAFEDVTELRTAVNDLEHHLAELRNTQAQLIQSGKLAAIGELAAGLAHELNNPLSAVLTYSILLRDKLDEVGAETLEPKLPRFAERLGLIARAAERCKAVADHLLAFSRQDETEKEPVDLGDVVRSSLELLEALVRRQGVHLAVDIEDGLPPVVGHSGQLQQVIVNLVSNAMHAMASDDWEHRGGLSIDARRAGDRCELTVEDTGSGIPAEHLDRIFEPFFTTKPTGEGTGLGLSIVHGIVQSHGGTIDVESEPGRGTRFVVRLPAGAPRGVQNG
ncbi:MAG: ATP-binding protein [Acidobacteriota bacterium]